MERDELRSRGITGGQPFERPVRVLVVVDDGVDASSVTAATVQRASERVHRATGAVVFAEFRQVVPLGGVALALRRPVTGGRCLRRPFAAASFGRRRPVLALELQRRHQTIKCRISPVVVRYPTCAMRQVLDARRASDVRVPAQPVRWQRLRAARTARHQPLNFRADQFHMRYENGLKTADG